MITFGFDAVKELHTAIKENICRSCGKSTTNIQVMITNHKKGARL
jgi:hypothetical protein